MLPKDYIHLILNGIAKEHTNQPVLFDVETKDRETFGDYSSTIAFSLSRITKKSPLSIAQEIQKKIQEHLPEGVERVEVAGNGFLNFFVSPFLYANGLNSFFAHGKHISAMGKKQRVVIDYSSPNVAKPMHIGHLRATLIGDFLARLYERLGYSVVRWNHLGDWGTQFGMLLAAYQQWGVKKEVERDPIGTLLALYVRYNSELATRPEMLTRAQETFANLERGEKTTRALWQWFVKLSLKAFASIYHQLDISFDVIKGESFYEPFLKPFIEHLVSSGVAKKSDGALIIDLGEQMPPALIQKSDGATLYLTRDLVSLRYRVDAYSPTRCLYVVADQQNLHFKQLFAVAKILGITSTGLEHIAFGMVLGANGKKLATREGNIISAQDIINELIALEEVLVIEKNPRYTPKQIHSVSNAVGVAALKYNLLKDRRDSDIVFDPRAALSLSGNSGPYIQYVYARLSRVVKKGPLFTRPSFSLLDDSDVPLLRTLFGYYDAVTAAYRDASAHHIADYLFSLASEANKYYETTPILKDTLKRRRDARLVVIRAVSRTIKEGLALLGISALEHI